MLPPLDWDKVGAETWGDVVDQVRKVGIGTFFGGLMLPRSGKRAR